MNAIKNLIISQSFQSKETKIGIITFNDKINFYDVRMTAKDIVKILITDPDDCVPPLPLNKWIFSPIWKSNNEDMNALLYLIDKLLKIIQDQYYKIESDGGVKQFIENNNYEYNCSKEVLITVQMCLKETGGRVVMMTSSAVGGIKIKSDTDRIGYGFSQVNYVNLYFYLYCYFLFDILVLFY